MKEKGHWMNMVTTHELFEQPLISNQGITTRSIQKYGDSCFTNQLKFACEHIFVSKKYELTGISGWWGDVNVRRMFSIDDDATIDTMQTCILAYTRMQCNPDLYYIKLHYIRLCYIMLYYIVLYCGLLYYIILYDIILYHIMFYCIMLYYVILCFIILSYIMWY